MVLYIASFSKKGKYLAEDIKRMFLDKYVVVIFDDEKATDIAARAIEDGAWLLYIGPTDKAVAAISPFVKKKTLDIPVAVVDEEAKFVLPIASGDLGHGTTLAVEVAAVTHGEPVLTMAKDIEKKKAIDRFAKDNYLKVQNREMVTELSKKQIRGEISKVFVDSEYITRFLDGKYPPSMKKTEDMQEANIIISQDDLKDGVLWLYPRHFFVGITCDGEKSVDELSDFILGILNACTIDLMDVAAIATTDEEKLDVDINKFTAKNRIPFVTFSDERLGITDEEIGAVCEKAAMVAAGEGAELLMPGITENGITMAIARRKI